MASACFPGEFDARNRANRGLSLDCSRPAACLQLVQRGCPRSEDGHSQTSLWVLQGNHLSFPPTFIHVFFSVCLARRGMRWWMCCPSSCPSTTLSLGDSDRNSLGEFSMFFQIIIWSSTMTFKLTRHKFSRVTFHSTALDKWFSSTFLSTINRLK